MTREEIIAEINAELAEEFEIDEATITPDAPIYQTLELDSLSLVDLIGIVQTKYGVLISKAELPPSRHLLNSTTTSSSTRNS